MVLTQKFVGVFTWKTPLHITFSHLHSKNLERILTVYLGGKYCTAAAEISHSEHCTFSTMYTVQHL